MATLIQPDGTIKLLVPTNGRDFSGEELANHIGQRYIRMAALDGDTLMFIAAPEFDPENTEPVDLPPNRAATDIWEASLKSIGQQKDDDQPPVIGGSVVVCSFNDVGLVLLRRLP